MAEIRREVEGSVKAKRNEMFAEIIAGPETAARLGVPVGTVVGARHIVMDAETGEQISSRTISPDEAARLIGE